MADIEALVDSILKMSPPVALMVGLNSVMYFLRRTPKLPMWLVPWIIMFLGSTIYPLITHSGDMIFSVPYPVVAQAIIGLIIGFSAIGSHRLFEQTVWRFGLDKNGTNDQRTDEPVDHETVFLTKQEADKKRHRPKNHDVGL